MGYSTPPVRLGPFKTGQEPLTPVPGEDGLVLLVPVDEPLSAGAPPVAPDLVQGVEPGWDDLVVQRRVRSGEMVSFPVATAPRPRWRISWTTLVASERAALVAFLRDEVASDGTAGGVQGFTVYPDGEGSAGAASVTVRPLAGETERLVVRASGGHGGDASGAGGITDVLELLCEEVF
jgi:hypothetical protein